LNEVGDAEVNAAGERGEARRRAAREASTRSIVADVKPGSAEGLHGELGR
jgi:hypothetical protein